ncbi:MAG: hypothetical protein F2839_04215 [Actinobacteria bacterium]|uniref:Unannotated protein n=1 Tax=freshwater metagenome TaxID=449393 RepID=A0A6J5ZH36_9ZZZZ|nr:hypothetical protein [Actinomycetota bacterium]
MSINQPYGNRSHKREDAQEIIEQFADISRSPQQEPQAQETQEISFTSDFDGTPDRGYANASERVDAIIVSHEATTPAVTVEPGAGKLTSGLRARLNSAASAPRERPRRAAHSSDNSGQTGELVPVKQAHLFLTHLDPWSVAKGAFVLGVTLAGITMVATIALWLMLSAAGVFEAITGIFNDVSGSGSGVSFLSLGRLIGLSMVVSAVEIVLISVMSTLFAVLYNLSVGFTGGIEVTLTDRSQ